MSNLTFTTPDNRFKWEIPLNWSEYEDGDEETFAFFNTTLWSGNLRITLIAIEGNQEEAKGKIAQLIEDELENDDAIKSRIGKYECAFYKTISPQDEGDLLNYHWTVGIYDSLFVCSFTIDKDKEATEINKKELEIVENIMGTIQKT